MSDYKRLKVWQKAQNVALESHRATRNIRGADNASLRSQITRAAFSIPANIVEGCGVQTRREYSRFVRIALNSSNELEYHLLTARDLDLLTPQTATTLVANVVEVRKMLHGLLRYLGSDQRAATPSSPEANKKGEM
jgi:four helix bundle protein